MPKKPPTFKPNHYRTDKQRRTDVDKYRGSRHERGYTNQWQHARKRKLMEEPLCRHCLRKQLTVAANEVDHIIPHRGDQDLFWDENNWQSLCKTCHSAKTAREMRQ